MPYYSKLVACSLLSATLLTGCNQSPKPPAQTNTKQTASTPASTVTAPTQATSIASTPTPTPLKAQNTVKETDTAQALLTVLSGLMYKSLNDNPAQKLTAEQKTCLEKANYHQFLPTFQQYLQGKLTADELTKTNQYYALPVGQKQIQLANQQLHASKGEKIANPVTLTDDEKLQIQAFQGTPEGQKLAQLLSPQNQSELQSVLTEPMTAKVTAECHIASENSLKGEQKLASTTASSTKS